MLNKYKYQCRSYPVIGKEKCCYSCKKVKDFGLFIQSKSFKDGCKNQCRECSSKERSKNIRVPDVVKDDVFYRTCRRCSCEKSLELFPNHPNGFNGKQRVCKDCNRIIAKERNYYSTEKRQEKEKSNPHAKMTRILRTRIGCALSKYKQNKITKAAKTLEMLGCDINFFVKHLESLFEPGMTWENHGSYVVGKSMTWNIDHTKPCLSFDLTNLEQQKQCFHYTNLRPMWAVDNLKKSYKS